jgi:hypothetical protein
LPVAFPALGSYNKSRGTTSRAGKEDHFHGKAIADRTGDSGL